MACDKLACMCQSLSVKTPYKQPRKVQHCMTPTAALQTCLTTAAGSITWSLSLILTTHSTPFWLPSANPCQTHLEHTCTVSHVVLCARCPRCQTSGPHPHDMLLCFSYSQVHHHVQDLRCQSNRRCATDSSIYSCHLSAVSCQLETLSRSFTDKNFLGVGAPGTV